VSGKDLFARELEGVLEKYYALKEKKLCSIRPPARERAAGRSMPNARSIG